MKTIKEALHYRKLDDGKVQCRLCNHFCVIPDSNWGRCRVRWNSNGKLYSLNYGKVVAQAVDPIEKKPLSHFLPGSLSYSIATVGCNFACKFCQNWNISQAMGGINVNDVSGMENIARYIQGEERTAKDIVEEAKKTGCRSIAYTYTEPTIFFEFAKDVANLGRSENLKNVFVTNGFMSPEAIDDIKGWVDAANIDIKSFSDEFYQKLCKGRLEPVLETAKAMVEAGIWVEITTLVIPEQNDSTEELKGIANFISEELGSYVPWHISAFHPDYKMNSTKWTPVKTLEHAKKIGEDAGLEYIYIGNTRAPDSENTKCPQCKAVVIKRNGYLVYENRLIDGRCPECGAEIKGVWE